jgi:hypothetical protein
LLVHHSYEGPSIGAAGLSLVRQWAALAPAGQEGGPFLAPPENWVQPFGAGFAGAEGAQPLSRRAWRAAGTEDESCFDRPMTTAELKAQEKEALEDSAAAFARGGDDDNPNLF